MTTQSYDNLDCHISISIVFFLNSLSCLRCELLLFLQMPPEGRNQTWIPQTQTPAPPPKSAWATFLPSGRCSKIRLPAPKEGQSVGILLLLMKNARSSNFGIHDRATYEHLKPTHSTEGHRCSGRSFWNSEMSPAGAITSAPRHNYSVSHCSLQCDADTLRLTGPGG